jgi:hypothetical protein
VAHAGQARLEGYADQGGSHVTPMGVQPQSSSSLPLVQLAAVAGKGGRRKQSTTLTLDPSITRERLDAT